MACGDCTPEQLVVLQTRLCEIQTEIGLCCGIFPPGKNSKLLLELESINTQLMLCMAAGEAGGVSDVNIMSVRGQALNLGQQLMAASLPVVIAADQAAIPISESATVTTGNLDMTVLDSAVTITELAGSSTVTVQSNYTTQTGNLVFEATVDGTTWQRFYQNYYLSGSQSPLMYNELSTSTPTPSQVGLANLFVYNVAGFKSFRVRVSTIGTGSLGLTLRSTPAASGIISNVTPGTSPTSLGKAASVAANMYAAGDVGVMNLSIYQAAGAITSVGTGAGRYVVTGANQYGAQFVDINTSCIPANLLSNSILKIEDSAHVSADAGVMDLGVAQNPLSPLNLVSAIGDYCPKATNLQGVGFMDINAGLMASSAIPTSILKLEDSAHASGDAGISTFSIRDVTLSSNFVAGTDGDYQASKSDQNGVLYVHPVPGVKNNTTVINYVFAAGTNATNFASGSWSVVSLILSNTDTAGVGVWFKMNFAVGGGAPNPGVTAANLAVFVPNTGVPVVLTFPYPLSGISGAGFWVSVGPENASNVGLTNANKMSFTIEYAQL